MDVSEADSEDGGRAYKSYVSYQSERNSHFVWLVSSKWFQLWKEKTRFDNLESGLDLDEDCINDDILPRLNEDLLDKEVDLSKFVFTKEEKFDIINTVCRPGLVEI
jgi:ubiquitin carboxyl-terminal hydrolase 4/11/15